MTTPDDIAAFRVRELLLERATEGLDDQDAAELAALGADHDVSYDLAAAAVDLATLRSIDALPPRVADKILIAAQIAPPTGVAPSSFTAVPTTLAGVVPQRPSQPSLAATTPPPATGVAPNAPGIPAPSTLAGVTSPLAATTPRLAPTTAPVAAREMSAPPPQPTDELARARARRSRAPMIAAYSAAAAGIAFAIGAVLWARDQAPRVVTKEIEKVVMPATPTPSEARARLLATAADVTTLAWTATEDPAAQGASGDVVWSPSLQQGFMRFVGLAVNDPTQRQYQLWIFDKDRDQAFPVDGGVFDITPAGEVIVPITAKLPVGKPVLFAVTVERPGGVVVSKRERIVVTAAPPEAG